jgi:hypothetical protein
MNEWLVHLFVLPFDESESFAVEEISQAIG